MPGVNLEAGGNNLVTRNYFISTYYFRVSQGEVDRSLLFGKLIPREQKANICGSENHILVELLVSGLFVNKIKYLFTEQTNL